MSSATAAPPQGDLDAAAAYRQYIIDACMQSILRNPFGEYAARTLWAPAARGETLANDIRRRLVDALGDYRRQPVATAASTASSATPVVKRDATAAPSQQPQPLAAVASKLEEGNAAAAQEAMDVVVKHEQRGDGSGGGVPTSSFQAALRAAKQRRAATASATGGPEASMSKLVGAKAEVAVHQETSAAQRVVAGPHGVVGDEAADVGRPVAAPLLAARPHQEIDVGDESEDDDDETFDVFIPNEVLPPLKRPRVEADVRPAVRHGAGGVVESPASTDGHGDDEATSATANKDPSMMTKDEFLQQFRRAPRRGEIGVTAEQVAEAQALGYVMSGSRNRASNNYVDRIQRQLHERQAGQLRLNFLKESDRRAEEAALGFFLSLAQQPAEEKR